ncbi:Dehydrogenase/reductase SDR member 7 [Halocaridina rubra]|uniref:Dehydrogenase/reductase SDR member 7 n=1 Tax=Halocaridina rubra TaxID=373956 RepID=A0AAN8WID1_HALRR
MANVDWFYIAAGCIGLQQLLLGWCTYTCCLYVIGFLAVLRYIVIPAECDSVLWFYKQFGKPVESLKGHVVWITGASSGIGKALAIRLARAGVRIAISSRSVESLNNVKTLCVETGGITENDVLILPLDMVEYDKHQPAFDAVLKHFGKLDILVSNAGRSQRARWEMIEADVDKDLFELNVFSLVALSRIVTRYFLEKGCGHHVVTSSTAGKLGVPMSASYTGSKHALQGYFECLRFEKAGCGLDISIFCPGPFHSNLLNVCFTEQKGEQLGQQFRGARMSADHCADLFAIGIANRVAEIWVAPQPVLSLYYLNQYVPGLMKSLLQLLPLKTIMKLRDGRSDVVQLEGAEAKKA